MGSQIVFIWNNSSPALQRKDCKEKGQWNIAAIDGLSELPEKHGGLTRERRRQRGRKEGKINTLCIPEHLCVFLISELLHEKYGWDKSWQFLFCSLLGCALPLIYRLQSTLETPGGKKNPGCSDSLQPPPGNLFMIPWERSRPTIEKHWCNRF